MDVKICTSCKQSKPVGEFHRIGKSFARIGNWCEPCFLKHQARLAERRERKDRSKQ